MQSARYIGCCGAYCNTCKPYIEGLCKGCKLGYDTRERLLEKARCAVKVCCFRDRQLETCAECPDFVSCEKIGSMYAKNGYKYKKYKQAVEFIRERGYEKFISLADQWKGPCGKLN